MGPHGDAYAGSRGEQNEKPQPESRGTGGWGFHLRDDDATKQSYARAIPLLGLRLNLRLSHNK